MKPESRSGRALAIYRMPGFTPFLLARLAAVFAIQIQAVVVAWEIYDVTGDPMSLAYAGLAQFLPMLLLLAPAGDLIDRYNRKTILALSWALCAVCSALLAWLSYQQAQASGSSIYAVLVLFGCARAFMAPALQSLLPQIVPRKHLAQSLATNGMVMKAAAIAGPIAGGLLYAWGGMVAYLVCLACFVGGMTLLRWVPLLYAHQHDAPSANQQAGIWRRFSEGIRFIRSHPIVLGAISLDLFAVLLGGVIALLPIYAQDILHVGPTGLGLLRSAMAMGEIAMGLYLSLRPLNRRVGPTLFCAVAVFGVANMIFAFSTSFWVSFFALMLAGAGDMVSVYIRGALIQYATPDYLRGRVSAVNMLFISSSNELGEFRAGASAAAVGAVPAAVLGASFTLAFAGGMAWRFKGLRSVDRFEDAEAASHLPAPVRQAT